MTEREQKALLKVAEAAEKLIDFDVRYGYTAIGEKNNAELDKIMDGMRKFVAAWRKAKEAK